MITATSIFASFAGALVVLIVALDDVPPLVQGCILTLLIAFMLFAYTAEMICDARERDDILVYIRAHVTYNLGIVMMLLSLGLILLAKGLYYLAPLPILGIWMPWLRDAIWLIRKPKEEWDEYLGQLQAEE
jgi:hypothetical protein